MILVLVPSTMVPDPKHNGLGMVFVPDTMVLTPNIIVLVSNFIILVILMTIKRERSWSKTFMLHVDNQMELKMLYKFKQKLTEKLE